MLAAIAKIFDPLGLLLPVTTYAKVLFQKVWKTKQASGIIYTKQEPLKGDDQQPEHIIDSWDRWRVELPLLRDLTVPRCLRDHRFQKKKQFLIYMFVVTHQRWLLGLSATSEWRVGTTSM